MTAYYNEIDPKKAAWLRGLMDEGLIAPGLVDETSIEDVDAKELWKYEQCHFFAGIGVWSYALRNAGWSDSTPVWTGSCPCQSFSASGKREGFDDKRHLWPAWFRLIGECRPDIIFGEQVASKDGLAWFDVVSADLEGKDYTVGAADLCAASLGAPHIRQRLYFVADSEHAERRPLNARGHDDFGKEAGRVEGSGLPGECGKAGILADMQSERCGEAGNSKRRPKERVGDCGEPSELADDGLVGPLEPVPGPGPHHPPVVLVVRA